MNYLLRGQCAYIGIKFEDRKKNDMQYTYISCKILKVGGGGRHKNSFVPNGNDIRLLKYGIM